MFKTIATLCFAVAASVGADDPPAEKTGVLVGQPAPEFSLRDQTGNERTLRELLRDGPVALVFYRSASW